MEKLSISVIKQLIKDGEVKEEQIEQLKKDERKGVQKIMKSYEKQIQKERELEKNYLEMCVYENKAYNRGAKFVAGIDEAGRGPLAGPVVACAVILPPDFRLIGLNDSKQLNERVREKFYTIIKERALSYGIGIVDSKTIDEINIFEATKLAMRQAVMQLKPQPDHLLIDAVELTSLPCTSESIIKGDAKSISIAAASVLAKVTRDHIMREIHNEYPAFDFASNMGYGTKHHMDTLLESGATPYHRKSFAPVRNVIEKV
ncbi:ribonuclease HII [Oceanobacillus bengalensis]|uniref:Ribonuclease HII n=1 Tax=Oceanobacillus bengalensis TaxID=1435466 RepID=A0A494Z4J4_9BACI|nr:ribonuclease HII [Oceanobacillus bengalensis]RKQ17388.1 ribonuclease HII [Oceanobacillus bengalensis]